MNRNDPALSRISMVTPSYNQGEFLEECIDSILSQNYPNLEYVIMDGGSTDNSVEIIKKYEKYLTYWQTGPDNGQYAAIDAGFRKTTGPIMGWLNSDDKLHHQALFKAAFLFTEHPDVEWLTGRTCVWERDGSVQLIVCEYLPIFSRGKYLNKDYRDPSIQQESTFWRRTLWERAGGGLKTDLKYAGDMELWTRFFRHARLHTADTLLGGFRKYGDQKTAHAMDKYDAEAEAVLDEEQRLFRAGEYPELPRPAPPLIVNQQNLRRFIDAALHLNPPPIYSLAGNADLAIDYLTKRLKSYSASYLGTRRYLETLEITTNAGVEEMSALVARLKDELVKRPPCELDCELERVVDVIAERWSGIAGDWREQTGLAHELATKLDQITQPEEIVKAMLVLILKKLRLFDFYVRHEPTFSRVYHGVRRLFVRTD